VPARRGEKADFAQSGGDLRILQNRVAQTVFDDKVALSDPKVREQLRSFLQGFAAFAETHK
jgi:hypothetical protein